MEKHSAQQESNEQAKAKKKAIKVVYISNPVEVQASKSDFRAIVQELTGRDSDIAKYPGITPEPSSCVDNTLTAPQPSYGAVDGRSPLPLDARTDFRVDRHHNDANKSGASPFEMYDEASTSQTPGNFPA